MTNILANDLMWNTTRRGLNWVRLETSNKFHFAANFENSRYIFVGKGIIYLLSTSRCLT